jgi:ABC-type proline/glycine betaine transport system substrate-binding protein
MREITKETMAEGRRDLAFHLVSIHGDADAFTRAHEKNIGIHIKMHHGPDWPDISFNENLLERILEDYEQEPCK